MWVVALGGPQHERFLLHVLPYTRGMQYLCAIAINNGAKLVWEDEASSQHPEFAFDRTREILKAAINKRKGLPDGL